MKYFIYDPYYVGLEEFDNLKAFHEGLENYDFYGNFCDDCWNEEVENIIAGEMPDDITFDEDDEYDTLIFYQKYQTHTTQKIDVVERPDVIDEDGMDENGVWWDELWSSQYGYAFKKIEKEEKS